MTRSGGAAGRVTAAVALVGMLVGRFESMVTAGALPAPLSQSSVGRAILALTRTTCAVAGYDILVEGT